MTETDTSRVERPCPNCGVTLNGWSGLRYCGHYVTHAHTDCINNLRHRAEKAEAERDAAWNDAIEVAADYLEPKNDRYDWTQYAYDCHRHATAIRSLKKGELT